MASCLPVPNYGKPIPDPGVGGSPYVVCAWVGYPIILVFAMGNVGTWGSRVSSVCSKRAECGKRGNFRNEGTELGEFMGGLVFFGKHGKHIFMMFVIRITGDLSWLQL